MLIDSSGTVAHRDTFGLSDHYLCNAVIHRDEGPLAIGGSWTHNQANPHRDGLAAFVNSGDSLTKATYGLTGVDQFNSITQDTSGNLIVAGKTSSYGAGESDFWLVSSSPPDISHFSRTYGGADEDECQQVLFTSDMGYLLAGMTRSFGPGTRNLWMVKTNSTGDSLWSRVFGGSGSQECNAAVITPDGGFAFAGHWNYNFWLLRTDSLGNMLWSRTYDGYVCRDLVLTQDGGFLLAGDIYSGGEAGWDGYVVRTDSSGNELWSKTLDENADDHFNAAAQFYNGGFILGGYSDSENGPDRVWLVRLKTELPLITVGLTETHFIEVRWIAPVSGTYSVYSTLNPNHEADPLGPDWTWEATFSELAPGLTIWTDPGILEGHKFYVVTRAEN